MTVSVQYIHPRNRVCDCVRQPLLRQSLAHNLNRNIICPQKKIGGTSARTQHDFTLTFLISWLHGPITVRRRDCCHVSPNYSAGGLRKFMDCSICPAPNSSETRTGPQTHGSICAGNATHSWNPQQRLHCHILPNAHQQQTTSSVVHGIRPLCKKLASSGPFTKHIFSRSLHMSSP